MRLTCYLFQYSIFFDEHKNIVSQETKLRLKCEMINYATIEGQYTKVIN